MSSFFARHKAGGANAESILVSQLQHGLTLEFENSDPLRRLRLTLSELLAIMNKVANHIRSSEKSKRVILNIFHTFEGCVGGDCLVLCL